MDHAPEEVQYWPQLDLGPMTLILTTKSDYVSIIKTF